MPKGVLIELAPWNRSPGLLLSRGQKIWVVERMESPRRRTTKRRDRLPMRSDPAQKEACIGPAFSGSFLFDRPAAAKKAGRACGGSSGRLNSLNA
jgi:hypothetical protein